jgi:hypothetical protein
MTENSQRLEEILGTAIVEYTPNAIKFTGLSLDGLEQLLASGYTTENTSYNAAPTTVKFIEFGRRCASVGAVATFDGVAFTCQDADVVIDAIKVVGVQNLDFAGEFVRFTRGCDEIEVSSQRLFAWWD